MILPIKTTLEDVTDLCKYLETKPTGATVKEAKTVLDSKRLDARKLNALKTWDLIYEEEAGHIKLTEAGRELVKGEEHCRKAMLKIVRNISPYSAIVERAAHQNDDAITTTQVAAHWHDHFRDQVGNTDKSIKDQAVCFFNIAAGAGLGTNISGRHGKLTRFIFSAEALRTYLDNKFVAVPAETPDADHAVNDKEDGIEHQQTPPFQQVQPDTPLGQAIFIAHGKNKKPLEQLKKILDQFKIPYKVAVEEPNLGRPISGKVRGVMQSCNCAILIFTADEEFIDIRGETIFRPSENVVYELGAAGYLYDQRIVIMKEENVNFPVNFNDLGYISFEKDELEAKTMDILKELIGFEIVKLST